jgi:MOSC domain-containing protein YiiM
MLLLSVNIGKSQSIEREGHSVETGIFKQPCTGPVQITEMGLVGDEICETENHGGVDQAVYLYGADDYAWWENELGQPLPPGAFGENLTVSGLESAAHSIGDRFRIGEVILEVTAPRIPCGTLATRMSDARFARRFQQAERPGLYCRVIQEGAVRAGDPVTLDPRAGEAVSVVELFRSFYSDNPDEATLRRILAAPIAIRYRRRADRLLRQLLA